MSQSLAGVMKRGRVPRILRIGTWIAAGCMLLGASQAGSATIEVRASETAIQPGDTVDISVVVSGLGQLMTPSAGAFDLKLTYDPAVFDFKAGTAAVGLQLGDRMAGETIVTLEPGGALIELTELSLLSTAALQASQPASFQLFHATFTAVHGGQGTFDVAITALGDATGAAIPVSQIMPKTVSVGSPTPIDDRHGWGLGGLTRLLLVAGSLRLRRAA
jgi:Cohesin domain